MLRLACLAFSLLGTPALCVASDAHVDTPAAQVTGGCKAKAAEAPVVVEAAASDAPVRRTEAVPARATSAAPGTTRAANTRWHRLLPGMFR